MQITLADFNKLIETYLNDIKQGQKFTKDDYLAIGRIWNSMNHYTSLQATSDGKRFYELVRDTVMDRIVEALNMKVGRGYSFHSKEYDFVLGGTMDKRHRYEIVDWDTAGESGAKMQ
jgi:hypothetical protein